MADRGRNSGRGGERGGRGGGRGGPASRGGRGGFAGGGGENKSRRESILDLNKYSDKKVRVKFLGGREVIGTLKGFDQLLNLVLDDTVENLRDPQDSDVYTGETRTIGLVICRGPSVVVISPMDGTEEISNPFLSQADE